MSEYRKIILSQYEYDRIKDMFMTEFLERALNIVIKEPKYISSSQSTRQGYARATRDMEAALKDEFRSKFGKA